MSKRRIIGTINGVIAAASYGTNPLFALPLYSRGMGVNSVLFFRYSIAVILYGVWLVCFKRISLKLAKNEIIPVFLLGLMFSLSSLTLFEAFNYIEAGIACTILFIYPVLVAVMMAIFYKEKLTGIIAAAIGLTSCGILLLYNGKPGTSLNLHGIALVIASAFLYAFALKKIRLLKAYVHLN